MLMELRLALLVETTRWIPLPSFVRIVDFASICIDLDIVASICIDLDIVAMFFFCLVFFILVFAMMHYFIPRLLCRSC